MKENYKALKYLSDNDGEKLLFKLDEEYNA